MAKPEHQMHEFGLLKKQTKKYIYIYMHEFGCVNLTWGSHVYTWVMGQLETRCNGDSREAGLDIGNYRL